MRSGSYIHTRQAATIQHTKDLDQESSETLIRTGGNLAIYRQLPNQQPPATKHVSALPFSALRRVTIRDSLQGQVLISSTGFGALESDKITLYRSILGCDVGSVFGVDILPGSDVRRLQKAIKAEKAPELDHIAVDKLVIWKVGKPAHPNHH